MKSVLKILILLLGLLTFNYVSGQKKYSLNTKTENNVRIYEDSLIIAFLDFEAYSQLLIKEITNRNLTEEKNQYLNWEKTIKSLIDDSDTLILETIPFIEFTREDAAKDKQYWSSKKMGKRSDLNRLITMNAVLIFSKTAQKMVKSVKLQTERESGWYITRWELPNGEVLSSAAASHDW